MRKTILLSFIASLIILLILPFKTWSASLNFDAQNLEIKTGNKFEIGVFLNPQGTKVNAVEGKLAFSSDMAEVEGLIEGGSAVSFWVEKPTFKKEGSWTIITFAGVSPGGIDGYLFSVVLKTLKTGKLEFVLSEGSILLDDGKGTRAALETVPFVVAVKEESVTPDINLSLDKDPPEPFAVQIVRDSKIEDNKWFAVFYTQDKGMGLDYYEVLETKSRENIQNQKGWIKAESPYVLKDQNRRSFIYVKAIDKIGNYYIAEVLPAQSDVANWYQKFSIYGIIMIAVILIWFLAKRKRKIKTQEQNLDISS